MSQAACRPPRRLSSRGRRRPLISLTPLIDVVFILLVFFMLASSFLHWRAIDLDAPVKAAAGASAEGALVVEIRANDLRLAGEPVGLDALTRRVGDRLAAAPDRGVVIKPAQGVPLQRTVAVLDRLKAAGVADLSLVRDPAPSGGG